MSSLQEKRLKNKIKNRVDYIAYIQLLQCLVELYKQTQPETKIENGWIKAVKNDTTLYSIVQRIKYTPIFNRSYYEYTVGIDTENYSTLYIHNVLAPFGKKHDYFKALYDLTLNGTDKISEKSAKALKNLKHNAELYNLRIESNYWLNDAVKTTQKQLDSFNKLIVSVKLDKNSKNVAQEKIIQICQNINSELIVPGSLTVNKNTVSFEVSQNATEQSVREMCSNIARATDLTTHISSIDLLKAMDQRNK